MTRRVWTAAPILLLASATARADVTDVAELFPAETLAFAEIGNPAATCGVVAAWARGTPLENGLRTVHDRKDAVRDHRALAGLPTVGAAAVVTSPEFLREVGRFRGAAVGLTGFTDRHEPQAAAAVLFGDSAAGGLLAQTFLSTSRDLRRVDTVDGVPVFQSRAFPPFAVGNDGKPVPLENPKPTEGRFEATYAYRSGLFVVGTNKAAVADVLGRFSGKIGSPSLAAAAGFKPFAADRSKPGAFCYLVPPALAKGLDAVRKADRTAVDADTLAVLDFVVNPGAFPVLTGNLEVGTDEVSLVFRAGVAPAQPSPLLGLLSGGIPPRPRGKTDPDVAAAVTLAIPKDGERVKRLLDFADACAKAGGTLGQLPSEQLAEYEKQINVEVRERVIGRLAAITFVAPKRQELPKDVSAVPLLVCHLDAEADAAFLADSVPKLWVRLSGAEKSGTPAAETIGGVRVRSLPGVGAHHPAPLHYGRSGKVVVFGLDRKWVARLAESYGTSVTEGHPGKPAESAAIAGRFGLGPLAQLSATEPPSGGEKNRATPAPGTTAAALGAILDSLPEGSLDVTVSADRLTAGVAIRGLRARLPGTVEKLLGWLERVGMEAVPGDGAIPPPVER